VITTGVLFLIVGILAGITPLWTIGILLPGAGLYVAFLGAKGQGVGGHRHYF
jgi:hypothetical protein